MKHAASNRKGSPVAAADAGGAHSMQVHAYVTPVGQRNGTRAVTVLTVFSHSANVLLTFF